MHYYAIEGPIGAGKSTLARLLAAELGYELLLERPEDNPFLPRFYRDPASGALPAQLAFLLQRAGQAEQLQQPDLFARGCVADFLFDKDRLFAELTLAHADYELYLKVFERLAWNVPPPQRVIYLTAPPELLLERIARRGREYEVSIDADYLLRLSAAYRRYFGAYTQAPVIEVDTARFDFLRSPDDFRELLSALREAGAGLRLPRDHLL
ncbi:deoxynucleoside kinase [Solimonas sp. K1W22B-7]|uniref:deoxynucleoside kinase n=1 Tax=Solimonas sp. K1W22B-7 TaxID=2303331 RepID=UPI001968E749|nr:deoxynucleoside kinase [Solimonas sp. K1W22B-7]